MQPLTPRRATWLVLRREAKRTTAEVQQLAQLREQAADVAEAIDLVQDFATLVRQRQPTQLDPWLTRATTSTIEALRRFATGLYEDYEAVKAGSGKFESERPCADKRVNTSCGVGFVYFCSILLVETLRCGPSNCTFPMTLSLP